jgi:uncharacterized membrane protein YqjE
MSRDEPGLIDALSRLGGSLFGMLQNRLELASLELGEAGSRLVFTIIASFAAVLLLGGAVVALTAWIAAALWNSLGQAVLVWIAVAYGLAGAGVLWWLRAKLQSDPPMLADTLAELRADAAFMRGEARPDPAPRHADDRL